jgi:hypothetical protein
MRALVALQRADGSWDLTGKFAAAIGRDLTDLEAGLADASGDPEEVRRAWATALALTWLDEHARRVEVEWRLLAAKARSWLDRVTAAPGEGRTWIDAAGRFLTTS